ncbi:MAG TPA: sigma-70 family RNA polymerase sigma factor [Planctomycetes bacterium]|nr:sigma-70 family RNA polymerase sigma factor [Planctomycetota bacterium]
MDEKAQRFDFQTTHWSLVLEAGLRSSPDSRQALARLCEAYWCPLYFYVRRRVGDSHKAEDLTQEFFTRLLDKDVVATANPYRGRFRSFLLTSLKNFLSNEWDKAKAQKRGGGRLLISLDFDKANSRLKFDAADNETPERLYERQWTMTLLELVMSRLRSESAAANKEEQFELLKSFITGGKSTSGYADVAARLQMSETAAKAAAHRLRNRYRQLLRQEIAQTVAGPDDVDDEIRRLFKSLES